GAHWLRDRTSQDRLRWMFSWKSQGSRILTQLPRCAAPWPHGRLPEPGSQRDCYTKRARGMGRRPRSESGEKMNSGMRSRAVCAIGLAVLLGQPGVSAQEQTHVNLVPMPSSVRSASGALKIGSGFGIAFTGHQEARLERAGQRFLTQLGKQTGLLFART